MPKIFRIIIPKMIERDLIGFLKKVYSEYKGNVLLPRTLEFTTKTEGFRKVSVAGNFSTIEQYEGKIDSIIITPIIHDQPNLRLDLSPDGDGFPKISFEIDSYMLADTDEEALSIKKRLHDILEFAKLLMKYSGAEYFLGGVEFYWDPQNPYDEDIGLLHCKEDSYIDEIQNFIEHGLKLSFNKEEVEQLVNTEGRIEDDGVYVTVYFFDIIPKEGIGSLKYSVKKFLEKKKNETKK